MSHGAVPAPPGPPYIDSAEYLQAPLRSAPPPLPPPPPHLPRPRTNPAGLAYAATARVTAAEVRWQDALLSW